MLLDGRITLITGAASGLGLATAKLLVAEGAKVVMADIADEAGQAAAADLGSDVSYEHADVSSTADMTAVVARVEELYGRLDAVVANVGILGRSAFRPLVGLR